MFEYIQKHKVIIQIIMTLMFVPFAFSGISSGLTDDVNTDVVAKIGSQEITQRVFEAEFQNYKIQLRERMGDKFDEAQFDTFANRQSYLGQMVDQAVLAEAAKKEHLSVSDGILAQALLQNMQIPKDAQGNIDFVQYQAIVKQRGQSTSQFEEGLRAQLSSGVVSQAAAFGNQALPLQADYLQKIFARVQLVEQKNLDAASYTGAVSVSKEQAQQYYQANLTEFNRPALFDLEYAVIPVLPADYSPTDAEIKTAFGAANATADELLGVRKDPVKLKEALQKVALGKMEAMAKNIIEASSASPQNLSAIAAKFGGKVEQVSAVTRKGSADLPAPLKSTEVREALTTSEMAASNIVSVPVAYETNLLVGRVIKSTPNGQQPFEVVQAEIEKKLKQKAVLAQMRADADKQVSSMSPAASIGAAAPMGLLLKHSVSSTALAQVMAVKEYPKFVVSEGDNGVSILRVVAAANPISGEQAELKQQISGWQGLALELQQRGFLQTLRTRYGVKLFPENLGGRDNPAKVKA